MLIETPSQKRKRLTIEKAWKIYKDFQSKGLPKCAAAEYISKQCGISPNTAYKYIKLKGQYERVDKDT